MDIRTDLNNATHSPTPNPTGGAVRVVLELAGVKNGFGKQLGSPNALNNARATVDGLSNMKTYKQVAADRNVSVEYLMKGAQMVNS